MSRVVICAVCGARSPLRSQFDEGCPECGSDELFDEDAYDGAALALRCVDCGREVDALPPGAEGGEESGRHTVDDDCPLCGVGELVPIDQAPPVQTRSEFGLARAAARKVLGRHAVRAAPIDVEAIALAEGLKVQRGAFAHDGLLVDQTIEVPNGDGRTERFVIAHELGHHELRHEVPEEKLEQEANAFASELLMPRDLLRAAVQDGASVRDLCRRFDVNRQPMIYALQASRQLNKVRLG